MPAWTTARDWTTNEFVTEAFMDAQVRDNMNALHNMTIVRRNAAVTGTSAYVAISWDVEDLDELACWVVGTPTRFTIPYTGRFEIDVTATMLSATGTGEQRIRVKRFNSGSVEQEIVCENGISVINTSLSVHGITLATSGDYLEVQQYAGSSGTAPSMTFKAWVYGRG